ncbi:MAG: transposase [Clostridiales bacterium]|nr:transposase [Clostridiales bacterium]
MILSEEHRIKVRKNKDLGSEIDNYCYLVKNLSNTVNYLIRQCYRIHTKLKSGKRLEEWEQDMLDAVNDGIRRYNESRPGKKELRYVDAENSFIADAYFLSWYLKGSSEYKAVPYATCSQICIQEKCREWKSFYLSVAEYARTPDKFLGCPHAPGYLDPKDGRGALVITSQNFHVDEQGNIRVPKFLSGIHIRARHQNVRQIRIKSCKNVIQISLLYEKKEAGKVESDTVMGIDLGVNNLIAAAWDSEMTPVIVNGRPIKCMNQYFNKARARLQKEAKTSNKRDKTRKLEKLTAKRNRKIKDYLHKASRKIVDLAEASGVGVIVIGNNHGWKQNSDMGNRINQNFVSIPYKMLVDMISYKARLEGIEVRIVRESYTSGTSYLDGEAPEVSYYNKTRRIRRGLFRSNTGICINADVNAAYQIIKLGGIQEIRIKQREQITKLKVA